MRLGRRPLLHGAAAFLLDLVPGLGAAAGPEPGASLVFLPSNLLLETAAPVRTEWNVWRQSLKTGVRKRAGAARDRCFWDWACAIFVLVLICGSVVLKPLAGCDLPVSAAIFHTHQLTH